MTIEIVKEFDGTYYANITRDGERVNGLPEYVSYNALRNAIKAATGATLPPVGTLHFTRLGRKLYAKI